MVSYFDEGVEDGGPTPIVLIDFGQSAPNHSNWWLHFSIVGLIFFFPILGGLVNFHLSFLKDLFFIHEET